MPREKRIFELEGFLALQPAISDTENGGYELLFDTLIQSGGEGTRTSVISARQLLFRIGALFVDVEVGREANSDRASLIGQMLDSSNPGHPPAGVPIALLDRGRNIARTSSNDNGEFQFQFVMKNNLKLCVGARRGKPVYLPITPAPAKTTTLSPGTKRPDSRSLGNVLVH